MCPMCNCETQNCSLILSNFLSMVYANQAKWRQLSDVESFSYSIHPSYRSPFSPFSHLVIFSSWFLFFPAYSTLSCVANLQQTVQRSMWSRTETTLSSSTCPRTTNTLQAWYGKLNIKELSRTCCMKIETMLLSVQCAPDVKIKMFHSITLYQFGPL